MSDIISANDMRVGTLIDIDGVIWEVIDFKKVRTGKGGAFVSSKLKNYILGGNIEKTFRSEEKVVRVQILGKPMVYLYKEIDNFCFMDNETYEQISLDKKIIQDKINYLAENMEVTVNYYNDTIIGIELPLFVNLKVVDTGIGLKGDTVSAPTKPAKLETGMTIQVPLFINIGDIISVDTRKGIYVERIGGK